MKHIITIIALLFSQLSWSAIWPDSVAPCNTTLDACAEGLPEGSLIEVQSNTINETVTVFKAISLVAGEGYQPVFTAFNGIDLTVSSASTHDLIIDGFTLTKGRISVNHLGTGELNLNITDNEILDNSSSGTSIRVLQRGTGTLNINVEYNIITHEFPTTGADVDAGAITVLKNLNNGDVAGRIYGNSLNVVGDNGFTVGIGIYNQTAGTVDLNVTGNEIFTTHNGIKVNAFSPATLTDLDITSNAIYTHLGSDRMVGINITTGFSDMDANLVNNSIIGALDGVFLGHDGADGFIDANIFNNLLAYGPSTSIPVFNNGANINNDYNLIYGFDDPSIDFTPGPNHISAVPMIKGHDEARLLPGSPAIDAADSLAFFLVADAPLIDADGTLRFKRLGSGAATPDIGAYESGDVAFNHLAETTSHISALDHPAINGDISLDDLHVTSNWNPAGVGGIYNDHNEGLYYELGNWRVFNQDFATIPDGATFNIMKYSGKSNTFEHTAAGGAATTRIDRSGMDGQPDLIVQVSQHWTGEYNDNAFGVYYISGNWYIININGNDLPSGANFNVYYQAPSKSAFRHRTDANNTFGNTTVLDHPALNGNNCAQVQITQDVSSLVGVDVPLGVYFDGIRWRIYTQDLSAMPILVNFHVTVSPEQASVCDVIFKTDFGW